jgi:hypothetical protein
VSNCVASNDSCTGDIANGMDDTVIDHTYGSNFFVCLYYKDKNTDLEDTDPLIPVCSPKFKILSPGDAETLESAVSSAASAAQVTGDAYSLLFGALSAETAPPLLTTVLSALPQTLSAGIVSAQSTIHLNQVTQTPTSATTASSGISSAIVCYFLFHTLCRWAKLTL